MVFVLLGCRNPLISSIQAFSPFQTQTELKTTQCHKINSHNIVTWSTRMRSWDQLNLFMLKCSWINLHTHFYLTYKVQFDILWHLEAVFSLLKLFKIFLSFMQHCLLFPCALQHHYRYSYNGTRLRFMVHLSNWDLRYISMLGLCWLILAQD